LFENPSVLRDHSGKAVSTHRNQANSRTGRKSFSAAIEELVSALEHQQGKNAQGKLA
jgi:hypothetical protein